MKSNTHRLKRAFAYYKHDRKKCKTKLSGISRRQSSEHIPERRTQKQR